MNIFKRKKEYVITVCCFKNGQASFINIFHECKSMKLYSLLELLAKIEKDENLNSPPIILNITELDI